MNRASAECFVLKHMSMILASKDDQSPNISSLFDLEFYPVLRCCDAFPPIRHCFVHIPLTTVIKKPIRLIWH
jgi:hypothetical protein